MWNKIWLPFFLYDLFHLFWCLIFGLTFPFQIRIEEKWVFSEWWSVSKWIVAKSVHLPQGQMVLETFTLRNFNVITPSVFRLRSLTRPGVAWMMPCSAPVEGKKKLLHHWIPKYFANFFFEMQYFNLSSMLHTKFSGICKTLKRRMGAILICQWGEADHLVCCFIFVVDFSPNRFGSLGFQKESALAQASSTMQVEMLPFPPALSQAGIGGAGDQNGLLKIFFLLWPGAFLKKGEF